MGSAVSMVTLYGIVLRHSSGPAAASQLAAALCGRSLPRKGRAGQSGNGGRPGMCGRVQVALNLLRWKGVAPAGNPRLDLRFDQGEHAARAEQAKVEDRLQRSRRDSAEVDSDDDSNDSCSYPASGHLARSNTPARRKTGPCAPVRPRPRRRRLYRAGKVVLDSRFGSRTRPVQGRTGRAFRPWESAPPPTSRMRKGRPAGYALEPRQQLRDELTKVLKR